MRLGDICTVIRSKNAGPFELTLDMIFPDFETYVKVLSSGAINASAIAKAYGIGESDILGIVPFEPANAIKATIKRPVGSGALSDTDIYGAQQHAPLMDLVIPLT